MRDFDNCDTASIIGSLTINVPLMVPAAVLWAQRAGNTISPDTESHHMVFSSNI
jgi:hypothetical protein